MTLSIAIRLFGTDETVPAPVVLRAGPLSAELEDGNLRYIRLHDREMIRAVSYIVRDRNWGTYRPEINNLSVNQSDDSSPSPTTPLRAMGNSRFGIGRSSRATDRGGCSLRPTAKPVTDFLTNRTGFVVLHPIEGVAGEPCTVEHVDGSIVETTFPDLIDPVQPMMDLRALTPCVRTGPQGHLPDGGRHVRNGGPAQLVRRVLQDLCAAARAAVALYVEGRRQAQPTCDAFRLVGARRDDYRAGTTQSACPCRQPPSPSRPSDSASIRRTLRRP